jgi:4-hydroxybenzoate polyprenyltransferase
MLILINKYIGWRNWAVLYYNSIIENVFIVIYIGIIENDLTTRFLVEVLSFLLFSIFSTTYGYLINDFSDRRLDALHGKHNTFRNDSKNRAVTVLIVIFIISIVFAIPFIENITFVILWAFWIAIATFYSLPPLRFKEKGKTGLILVVFAQRVIPVMLLFAAFNITNLIDIVIILNLILARGFSSDIHHQWQDFENDRLTNTTTSAVKLGIEKTEKLFVFILEYEKISMILTLGLIACKLYYIRLFDFPYFLVPLLLYLVLYIIGYIRIFAERNHGIDLINPYKIDKKDIFQVIHLMYPNVFLSLYFLLYVTYKNSIFIVIFVLIILFYRLYEIETLKNSFIGRYLGISKK